MSSIPNQELSPQWLSPSEGKIWRDFMLMTMQLNAVLNRDLLVNNGLSGGDYAILVALSDRDSRSMRIFELGRELGWEKSRLSHQLTRMSQRDLVKKTLSPNDARGAIVHITNTGYAAIVEAAPRHAAAVREHFIDIVEDKQLQALGEIAKCVLSQLEQQTGC